eukprot:Hpha_TRINITY_DN21452_c0_g1::TRINITY_DN21452_c0_g1_i1::g.148213::m.148213
MQPCHRDIDSDGESQAPVRPVSSLAADAVRACGVGTSRRELVIISWCLLRRYRLASELVSSLVVMRFPFSRPFDFLRTAARHRLQRLSREVEAAASLCHGQCHVCIMRYLDGGVKRCVLPVIGDYVRLRRSADSNGVGCLMAVGGVLD